MHEFLVRSLLVFLLHSLSVSKFHELLRSCKSFFTFDLLTTSFLCHPFILIGVGCLQYTSCASQILQEFTSSALDSPNTNTEPPRCTSQEDLFGFCIMQHLNSRGAHIGVSAGLLLLCTGGTTLLFRRSKLVYAFGLGTVISLIPSGLGFSIRILQYHFWSFPQLMPHPRMLQTSLIILANIFQELSVHDLYAKDNSYIYLS